MIIAITPFPSIEYIYEIQQLIPNCSLASKTVSLNILSKGIYCSQMIKVLQEEPMLLSSLGGFAGKSIKHYLDKSKVKSDVVWSDYETPHQVKIVLESSKDYYDLCSSEPILLDKELVKLSNKLKSHIKKVSTLIISGKLPKGQNPKIFEEWIHESKLHNVKTILSTGQKEVLAYALEEKPHTLMFTVEQLKQLDWYAPSYAEIIQNLVPLLGNGIHYICVYMKNEGALVLSKNKYCLVNSPIKLPNLNNTAASGAFLGALAVSINRQYEQEKMAKLSLCASLAANDNVNRVICSRKDIESKLKKTKVKQLILN